MTSTREQIIEKTCNLLELQGYYATGLNQIIKESGTPKGSLYYHFPGGKEELAVEAVNHVGRIVLQRIRENLAQIDDCAESVSTFIKNIALNVEQSGFRAGGPITIIAMETASTNPMLREECQRIYEEWQAVFADKLRSGHFEEHRAQRMAALIVASIEGGVILCRTSHSKLPLEQISDEIALLISCAR